MHEPYQPTRTAALERLAGFVQHAGKDYATGRNIADSPGRAAVSGLSPYISRGLLREPDVLRAVLAQHSPEAADKFVQEVCWRTYWKGWLEMRPGVWTAYRHQLAQDAQDTALAQRVEAAESGSTGIDCFDAWARELAASGYLHNHVRMWAASIWIFTLRLPWTLGADWFLRHLLDGDAASNTLSWRWVAGLQTQGKHYLARAENIAKFTRGAFNPVGQLDESAEALPSDTRPPADSERVPAAREPDWDSGTVGVLLTDEALSLDAWGAGQVLAAACAVLDTTHARSHKPAGAVLRRWMDSALGHAQSRLERRAPTAVCQRAAQVAEWAQAGGMSAVEVPHVPIGPGAEVLGDVRTALADLGIEMRTAQTRWQADAWPHATRGFFRFKKVIPELLTTLGDAP